MSEKHTDGAMRAAKRISELDWTKDMNYFAAIIDEEITAERDRLRESNVELREACRNFIDNWITGFRTQAHGELFIDHTFYLIRDGKHPLQAALAKSEPESGEKDNEKP